MPWNEPGNNNSGNQDPWGGGQKNRGQGSFDLERWLRQWLKRLSENRPGNSGSIGGVPVRGIILAAIILIGAWFSSGFYIVGPGERGVVLRFGAFTAETLPGPHWHLPHPFASIDVVDIGQIRSTQNKSQMLTQDENIVDVDVSAQYRISNAKRYLFVVRNPNTVLRRVLISAIREVVGQSKMDYVVGGGRAAIALRTQEIMQKNLDNYQAGLQILKVNLQSAQPPEQVQGAFEDAIKAREDEVRYRNEAEAYANSIVPQARGEAARIEEESRAYKAQVVARAQGNTARFGELLKEYLKAPRVTRERLYIDTLQSVLEHTPKVFINSAGERGRNLFYFPLSKLLKGVPGTSGKDTQADGRPVVSGEGIPPAAVNALAGGSPSQSDRLRIDTRIRGGR